MTSINRIKTILDSFEPYGVAGNELNPFLYLNVNITPQLQNETIIEHFQDANTVEILSSEYHLWADDTL